MFNLFLTLPPSPPFLIGFNKTFDRSVPGLLYIIREKTGRKLSHPPMILNAVAADTLPAARFIGAVAARLVFFNLTFHSFSSCFGSSINLPQRHKDTKKTDNFVMLP